MRLLGLAVALAAAGLATAGLGEAAARPSSEPWTWAQSAARCPPPPDSVRVAEAARTCSAYDEFTPCPLFAPIKSDRCRADKTRSQGLEVDYEYFGDTDCRTKARTRDVDTIVLHNGGAAAINTRTWQCRRAAAHYTINRDGAIFQHIGEERTGMHARGNGRSIGIELATTRTHGKPCTSLTDKTVTRLARKHAAAPATLIREACAPTSAQYRSLRRLIGDIRRRHDVPTDNIIGHCEVGKKHFDPAAFDWARIGMSNADKQQKVASTDNSCRWYHLE